MLIYHSGLSLRIILRYQKMFPDRKLNALLTFGIPHADSYRLQTEHRNCLNSLILDSGTYSLNTCKGNTRRRVTFEGYRTYLREFSENFDEHFNFDENWDKDGYSTNLGYQLKLENEGFTPIPAIHNIYGDEVDEIIERGYKYVAIGSSELVDKAAIGWIVDKLFKAGIKVHLFGTSRFNYLIDNPVCSCDTSNWTQVAARDQILYWNPNKQGDNKTDTIVMECFVREQAGSKNLFTQYEYHDELEAYLENELGVKYLDLLGEEGLFNRQLVNVHFFAELERRITENHLQHGWPY